MWTQYKLMLSRSQNQNSQQQIFLLRRSRPQSRKISSKPRLSLSQNLPRLRLKFISTKYPGARIVEIEREGVSVEVDIIDGTVHREVVFSAAGEWKYTETEMRRANVSQTVMEAFNGSQYKNYPLDDIDHYDTPDGDFYIFELNTEPDDIYIKIYPNGTIEAVSGKLF